VSIINGDTVQMPAELILGYEAAQRRYITAELQPSAHWFREDLIGFASALHWIVRAATENTPEAQDEAKLRALDALNSVRPDHNRAASPPVAPSGDVILPRTIVDLFREANRFYLRYARVFGFETAFIARFRDTLDHLVDAGRALTPPQDRSSAITIAMEHLVEVVGDSVWPVSQRNVQRALAKRWLRTFQNGLPSDAEISQRLAEHSACIITGRVLRGRTRQWHQCIQQFRRAFNEAFLLEREMTSGAWKWWVYVSFLIAVSAIGSLIVSAILRL
jgi:hypothetical protein